jgi:hypothetical protein
MRTLRQPNITERGGTGGLRHVAQAQGNQERPPDQGQGRAGCKGEDSLRKAQEQR